jgi:hypothetical protein
MILDVKKSPDRKFTKYVKDAADYYLQLLIPSKRLRNNITLHIKFLDNMDVWGMVWIEDYNSSNKAREFQMLLHSSIGAASILKTLAHEMVHVKQYVYGEINESLSVWRGVNVDSDVIDYYFHPWEIEAMGLQESLFTKYVLDRKLWEVFEGINNPDGKINPKVIGWKKS